MFIANSIISRVYAILGDSYINFPPCSSLISARLRSFTACHRSLWTGDGGVSRLSKTRFRVVRHYPWFSRRVFIREKLTTVSLSQPKIPLPWPRGFLWIFGQRSYSKPGGRPFSSPIDAESPHHPFWYHSQTRSTKQVSVNIGSVLFCPHRKVVVLTPEYQRNLIRCITDRSTMPSGFYSNWVWSPNISLMSKAPTVTSPYTPMADIYSGWPFRLDFAQPPSLSPHGSYTKLRR